MSQGAGNPERTFTTGSRIHRLLGAALSGLIAWQVGTLVGHGSDQARNAALGLITGAIIGFVLAPYVLTRPLQHVFHTCSRSSPGEVAASLLGLVLGLAVAVLLSFSMSYLPWSFGHMMPLVITMICVYVGVSLLLTRRDDLNALFGWTVAESSEPAIRYLVDTSAIIDGRIADVSHAGFIYGTLVVPRFVLRELQHIADSSDPLRRNRGRRGLEVLNRLQKEACTPVDVVDADARDVADVDGKLVKLARQLHCPVITNDFNLNRIAELQGVRVLNINQLANALKAVVLPGEEMAVHIVQEGKEQHQGVAYLDDGTMIVVEQGRLHLHATVDVIVTRVLQTAAGRMIFAQPKGTLQA